MKLPYLFGAFLLLLPISQSYAKKVSSVSGKKTSPQNIIFDNDMGNDVDDIMAIDILLKYQDMGKIKVLGILSNRDAPSSIAFCDLYDTWCGYPQIPLGIVVNGSNPTPEKQSYATKILNLKVKGKKVFKTTYSDPRNLPNAVDLYRKLLSKAKDKSVIIISTGFSSNLSRLMETQGDKYSPLNGTELLKKKVSWISVMAGNFRTGAKGEYNVTNDIPAAKKFFEETPVPLAFSDFDLGKSIRYPGTSVLNDFKWVKHHPFVEAYKTYAKMPYDRPTWDPTSVLYALEPNAGFFGLSDKGNVSVDAKGVTTFTPSATGKCRYLTVTDTQRKKILDFFIKFIPQRPRHCMLK